jgi:hypothetical protein
VKVRLQALFSNRVIRPKLPRQHAPTNATMMEPIIPPPGQQGEDPASHMPPSMMSTIMPQPPPFITCPASQPAIRSNRNPHEKSHGYPLGSALRQPTQNVRLLPPDRNLPVRLSNSESRRLGLGGSPWACQPSGNRRRNGRCRRGASVCGFLRRANVFARSLAQTITIIAEMKVAAGCACEPRDKGPQPPLIGDSSLGRLGGHTPNCSDVLFEMVD